MQSPVQFPSCSICLNLDLQEQSRTNPNPNRLDFEGLGSMETNETNTLFF